MTIDNNVYRKAERYARLHNTSVERFVEHTISSYIDMKPLESQSSKPYRDTEEFKNAMAYMETLVADDLKAPVPADYDASKARTEKYEL